MITVVDNEDSYTIPTIDDVSITYIQDADCVSDSDSIQTLKVHTENNGVGRFMVLETERWAIDDVEGIIEIIKDFATRAGLSIDKTE